MSCILLLSCILYSCILQHILCSTIAHSAFCYLTLPAFFCMSFILLCVQPVPYTSVTCLIFSSWQDWWQALATHPTVTGCDDFFMSSVCTIPIWCWHVSWPRLYSLSVTAPPSHPTFSHPILTRVGYLCQPSPSIMPVNQPINCHEDAVNISNFNQATVNCVCAF